MFPNSTMTDIKKDFCIMQTDYGNVWKVHDVNKDYTATILWNRYDDYSVETKAELIQTLSNSKLYTHPYIQKTIDYSVVGFGDEKNITILNEYCADTLREVNLSLPYEQKIIHLYGIAEAMKYLHEHRIINRDLKTPNVLLDSELHPYLTDFGTSKIIDQSIQINQTLQSTTLPYMAPEFIIEPERYSNSFPIDVYSFGITLYELITELPPWPKFTNAFQLFKAVIRGERPEMPPSVPSNWKELITACWAQEPDCRPTFAEICDVLESDEFVNDSIDKQAFEDYKRIIHSAKHV